MARIAEVVRRRFGVEYTVDRCCRPSLGDLLSGWIRYAVRRAFGWRSGCGGGRALTVGPRGRCRAWVLRTGGDAATGRVRPWTRVSGSDVCHKQGARSRPEGVPCTVSAESGGC
ncbi:hypothetical protein ABT255_03610 [Streptomyces mirabilis]